MKKALIVIDVQGFFENDDTKKVADKIYSHIKRNKDKYNKVIFTIFKNNEKAPLWNTFEWTGCKDGKDIELIGKLKEFQKEAIPRNTYSCLKSPKIKKILKDNNIKEVYLCGFDTDCCVLSTTYDLFDSGYSPTVLKNLCFSVNHTNKPSLHEPSLSIVKKNCGFLK